MALIDPELIKADIPHEPGQWVKYRCVTAGDLEDLALEGHRATNNRVISLAVQEWSYPGEPSYEAIRKLDLVTLDWLTVLVNTVSGVRSDEKKDESEPPSSGTSDQAEDDSPPSSDT